MYLLLAPVLASNQLTFPNGKIVIDYYMQSPDRAFRLRSIARSVDLWRFSSSRSGSLFHASKSWHALVDVSSQCRKFRDPRQPPPRTIYPAAPYLPLHPSSPPPKYRYSDTMKYLLTLLTLGLASAAEVLVGNTATPEPAKTRQLNVTVGVEFVDAVPEFGIKAINGIPTRINLHVTNFEAGNVGVQSVRGSLWSIEKGVAVKNFTSLKVGTTVAKDEQVCWLWLEMKSIGIEIGLGRADGTSTTDRSDVPIHHRNAPPGPHLEPRHDAQDPRRPSRHLHCLQPDYLRC